MKLTPKNGTNVCPYIMVDIVEDQMDFLKNVFDATVIEDAKSKDGILWHAKVLIEGSVVMIGKKSDEDLDSQNMTFVYVANVDAIYSKSIEYGATSIEEPTDRIYGVKVGAFLDKSGHQWWIGEIKEDLTKEEIYKRKANNYGVKKD